MEPVQPTQETKPAYILSPEPLSVENMDRKLWLVKIPRFVAEKWGNVQESGIELGKVRIYANAKENVPPKVSLHLPDAAWAEQIPKNYNLLFTNTTPTNEYVVSESSNGRWNEISGKVHHEATVSPVIDDDYRKIMKARSDESSLPTRSIKIMDKMAGKTQQFIVPNLMSRDAGFGLMKRSKGSLDKRERLPRDDLLNLLFSAFSKEDYWSLRALSDFTQQPLTWLKDVLLEIATLNKRGPYSGMYELKAEMFFNFYQRSLILHVNHPSVFLQPSLPKWQLIEEAMTVRLIQYMANLKGQSLLICLHPIKQMEANQDSFLNLLYGKERVQEPLFPMLQIENCLFSGIRSITKELNDRTKHPILFPTRTSNTNEGHIQLGFLMYHWLLKVLRASYQHDPITFTESELKIPHFTRIFQHSGRLANPETPYLLSSFIPHFSDLCIAAMAHTCLHLPHEWKSMVGQQCIPPRSILNGLMDKVERCMPNPDDLNELEYISVEKAVASLQPQSVPTPSPQWFIRSNEWNIPSTVCRGQLESIDSHFIHALVFNVRLRMDKKGIQKVQKVTHIPLKASVFKEIH